MNGIPAVDLFCGAGGLSIGAARAGADVRLMVDLDPLACATLRANPKHHTGEVAETGVSMLSGRDIRARMRLGRRDSLLVIGGPPCQPFSKAAYWTDPGDEARYRRERAKGRRIRRPTKPLGPRPDDRRSLLQEFWRIVQETRADAFVFENVPSILHPRNRTSIEALMQAARMARYRLRLIVANAVEFGVPQRRVRVFLLGLRGAVPPEPVRTHWVREEEKGNLRPPATAGSALKPYAGSEYREPEELVTGRWAEHLRTIPPGMNYKAHTKWGGHPNPTFETETRFWNFLLKLSPDMPSWTIAANPGPWTGPFHWRTRRLRTCELAALQGFPGRYRFTGNRRERVRQIGNAVPPPLAAKMIRPMINVLTGRIQDLEEVGE